MAAHRHIYILIFLGQRHHCPHGGPRVPTEQQVDFVDGHGLVRTSHGLAWIRLIVVNLEDHRSSQEPALGVDLFCPAFHTAFNPQSIIGVSSRLRQGPTDHDGFVRGPGCAHQTKARQKHKARGLKVDCFAKTLLHRFLLTLLMNHVELLGLQTSLLFYYGYGPHPAGAGTFDLHRKATQRESCRSANG